MKKAQIEIVGLLIIVILLAVILVIALRFYTAPKSDTLQPQKLQTELGSALSSILDTNTDLDPSITTTIREEIKSCIIPCTNTQRELRGILDKIFKNKKYSLEIKSSSKRFITPSIITCNSNEFKILASQKLTPAPDPLEAILILCEPKFS